MHSFDQAQPPRLSISTVSSSGPAAWRSVASRAFPKRSPQIQKSHVPHTFAGLFAVALVGFFFAGGLNGGTGADGVSTSIAAALSFAFFISAFAFFVSFAATVFTAGATAAGGAGLLPPRPMLVFQTTLTSRALRANDTSLTHTRGYAARTCSSCTRVEASWSIFKIKFFFPNTTF